MRNLLLTKGLILCIKSPTEDTKCSVYKNNKFIDYFCLAVDEIKFLAEFFSFIAIKYKNAKKFSWESWEQRPVTLVKSFLI